MKIQLNDAELLYGGDYYAQTASWKNIQILDSISATNLNLGVTRTPGSWGGACFIGYQFKPKN